MNGIRSEIDVRKCGKDNSSTLAVGNLESLITGFVLVGVRSITCPAGTIDYENNIIGAGSAMYSELHINT